MDTKGTSKEKKIRVICTRTGTKFNHWWEDNLKFMVDKHSGLEYDEFVVIKDEINETTLIVKANYIENNFLINA